MSKVVKNPLRGTAQYERQAFVPEWVRIGVTPFEYEGVQQEFRMLPKKTKTANHRPPQAPSRMAPAPELDRKPASKQTLPNVGQGTTISRDLSHKVRSQILANEVPSPPPLYSRKDCPPPKHRKVVEEDQELDEDFFNADPHAEDYSSYDDQEQETELEVDESETEEQSDFKFEAGQYALLIRGQVVFVSTDLKKMEMAIEDIVYNGLDGEEIDFKDLALIKRLPLKMGVLAIE